jgi:multiple sugar transport system substrate-binding protein
MHRKKIVAAGLAVALTAALAGCSSAGNSSSGSGSGGGTTINAVMWDPTQLPVYKKCAVQFKKKTGITVDLSQTAWATYWAKLTTQLAAGTGPDVFTDHVNYFDQFASTGQLLDLKPYLKKDGYTLDTSAVPSNKLWQLDGKQYSVSQDKDVTGMIYNEADLSSYSPAAMSQLTWNPNDGGTFQKMIAHLTVDKNGNRGDSPAFDKNNIKTYGFAMESGSGVSGQASWSNFAFSTGWLHANKNPNPTKFNLDDPRFVKVWDWLQSMYNDGYIAPPSLVTSLGEQPLLDQNKTATMVQGSWEAAQRVPSADKAQKFQWAQLPTGPAGHPVSMSNSIGPSVNAGTKHPAEAAKWAAYVVSPTCQNIVAKSGVEIPIIPSAATTALATLKSEGVDTSGWSDLFAHPSWLRAWPLTKAGARINDLSNNVFDNTLPAGKQSPATVLKQLNDSVNALLKN